MCVCVKLRYLQAAATPRSSMALSSVHQQPIHHISVFKFHSTHFVLWAWNNHFVHLFISIVVEQLNSHCCVDKFHLITLISQNWPHTYYYYIKPIHKYMFLPIPFALRPSPLPLSIRFLFTTCPVHLTWFLVSFSLQVNLFVCRLVDGAIVDAIQFCPVLSMFRHCMDL